MRVLQSLIITSRMAKPTTVEMIRSTKDRRNGVGDQRQLMNGFRYIKELLLQSHTFICMMHMRS